MKPNFQEPIGKSFHSVYLSACCARDILILNVFLFNNHIIKGERIIWKNLKVFTPHCVDKGKKKENWRNSSFHMLIFSPKVWDGKTEK